MNRFIRVPWRRPELPHPSRRGREINDHLMFQEYVPRAKADGTPRRRRRRRKGRRA